MCRSRTHCLSSSKSSSHGSECIVQHCCSKYGLTIDDISYGTPNRIDKDFFENVDPGIADIARVLLG